ncbi:hypothetical protein ACFVXG_22280 [Kitasatospora sp. NPDC058162]|uniref:hypothetical protein n=1 Tax=Kitasatospora sp. NPDC058162 TaxID=3346362 RepID=UPI0036D96874
MTTPGTTEPETSGHLTYTLATVPEVLTSSTPQHPQYGRLDITVTRSRNAPGSVRCRGITLELPTGTHPGALTAQPESIDTTYSATRGRSWHILKNTAHQDRTLFTCTPENPRQEAVFDGTWALTLTLDGFPLTTTTGVTAHLRITEDTATAPASYRTHTIALPIGTRPADRNS